MKNNRTYISIGDFIDLFYKVKQKGYANIVSKLHQSDKSRTVTKWNSVTSSSDFWIIPEVRTRWNEKCTGDPTLEYEDYVVSKYLSEKKGLTMLSVGCGSGARERKFGKYPNFDLIVGIEMAAKQVEEARKSAADLSLNNLKYIVGDFYNHEFSPESYDVILFNSSLHHFNQLDKLIPERVCPLLKKGGLLVIFEYVGPDRLQWTNLQLSATNQLLKELPLAYKRRFNSRTVKRRVYRPGLLRMQLVDPSEAIDSTSILPSIHLHLKTLEERKVGWDITHLLFKDIAHNFLDKSSETQQLLSFIFDKEDEYLALTGRSDVVFGVYQKAEEPLSKMADFFLALA
jgi:ubiquinone/menaquinone biosynthesis C-methylase UbiE